MMIFGTLLGLGLIAGLVYLYLWLSNRSFAAAREELAKLDKYAAADEATSKTELAQEIADFSGDGGVSD